MRETYSIALFIADNIIDGNTANGRAMNGHSGGGIWLDQTNASVKKNTIVGNRANGPTSAYGGGIAILNTGRPIIEENVIALSTNGGGILCALGVTPSITNNLVWGNAGGDTVGDCMTWIGEDGNIQADPLFCGAADGDFSLPLNSPALTQPGGPIGAIPTPGCLRAFVEPTTWSRIKTLFLR